MRSVWWMAGGLALAGAAPFASATMAEEHRITFPEGGSEFGNLFAFRYLGPNGGGEVLSARFDITFSTIGSFDASNLNIFFATPIIGEDGELAFYNVSGLDLGWTGQGTFTASIPLPQLTGTLAGNPEFRTLWQLDVLGDLEQDPPLFFGSFTDTAFVFDVKPVPAPGALAGGALAGLASLRRRQR